MSDSAGTETHAVHTHTGAHAITHILKVSAAHRPLIRDEKEAHISEIISSQNSPTISSSSPSSLQLSAALASAHSKSALSTMKLSSLLIVKATRTQSDLCVMSFINNTVIKIYLITSENVTYPNFTFYFPTVLLRKSHWLKIRIMSLLMCVHGSCHTSCVHEPLMLFPAAAPLKAACLSCTSWLDEPV